MNITDITVLETTERVLVNEYNEDGSFKGNHIETKKNSMKYNMGSGALSIDNEDGTGISFTVSPVIINAITGWINRNIQKSEAADAAREAREVELHQVQMKREEARAKEAELQLEEQKLRHEIRMVELQTELAEKKLELKRAEAELAGETNDDEEA